MINLKNLDPNKIKIDEKPNKTIPIFYIEYVTVKNPLYLLINKINGYIEKCNENKYLTLVLNNESKDTLKYEELWNKIRDIIRSKTNNSDDYDEKNIKIKFNSYDGLIYF